MASNCQLTWYHQSFAASAEDKRQNQPARALHISSGLIGSMGATTGENRAARTTGRQRAAFKRENVEVP